MNGVMYSNTKFFEDSLGWIGILIEPTNQFNSLKVNRVRKNIEKYELIKKTDKYHTF